MPATAAQQLKTRLLNRFNTFTCCLACKCESAISDAALKALFSKHATKPRRAP